MNYEYVTTDDKVFAKAIHLYDGIHFSNISTKYICWYADTCKLSCTDKPDMNADCIFEKTINPDIDSGCYVCVKCGNEYRESLAKFL